MRSEQDQLTFPHRVSLSRPLPHLQRQDKLLLPVRHQARRRVFRPAGPALPALCKCVRNATPTYPPIPMPNDACLVTLLSSDPRKGMTANGGRQNRMRGISAVGEQRQAAPVLVHGQVPQAQGRQPADVPPAERALGQVAARDGPNDRFLPQEDGYSVGGQGAAAEDDAGLLLSVHAAGKVAPISDPAPLFQLWKAWRA